MPKKDDTDIIVTIRENDDDWRELRDFKILTGIEADSTAYKLAVIIAKNVIQQLTSGKFKLNFSRMTVEDFRAMQAEPPQKEPKV